MRSLFASLLIAAATSAYAAETTNEKAPKIDAAEIKRASLALYEQMGYYSRIVEICEPAARKQTKEAPGLKWFGEEDRRLLQEMFDAGRAKAEKLPRPWQDPNLCIKSITVDIDLGRVLAGLLEMRARADK